MQIYKKITKGDLVPVVLFELYLFMTLFLYFFGPLKYDYQNTSLTIFFILSYQCVFFWGYFLVFKKRETRVEEQVASHLYTETKRKNLLFFSLLVAILVSYISLVQFSFSFNIITIAKNIISGVLNPAYAYSINTSIKEPFIDSRIINIVLTVGSIFSYYAYTIGAYLFTETTFRVKILYILAVFLEVSTGLIRGTNISIFRMIVILFTIIIIKSMSSQQKLKLSKKKIALFLVLIVAFLVYFLLGTSSRMALREIPDEIFRLKVDKNNLFMKVLPNAFKMPFIMFSFYLSQGYHAFSLIFNYTFHTTFGVGSGWFILNNFAAILPIPLFARTYIAKMRYYWNPTINWHSAYTWFANDLSVFGVIFLMYFLGKLLSKTIIYAKKGDLLSIAIFPLLVLMLIFFPANNVVLSAPQTALPFLTFVLVFVIRECKKNRIKKTKNNFLFLGSVYEPTLESYYLEKSKGHGIQNAINTHQWNLIKGISKYHQVEVLSSRYLHQYPSYQDAYISNCKSLVNEIYVNNIAFVNVKVFKQISKSFAIFKNLFNWALRTGKECRVIFIYYPSSIFLFQASFIKKIFKNIKLISIIPDLPENTNLSQQKDTLNDLNEKLFNYAFKSIDKFVLLTEQMAEYYDLKREQYFIIDGLVNSEDFNKFPETKYSKPTVVYSGSLNIKYGIKNLVDSFVNEKVEADLIIFGKGEYEEELLKISAANPNILYKGYVPREQILQSQKKAHVLINPRNNEGSFNKYSFPSKNMEYMLSGTPFIGYQLSGMGDEYLSLYTQISDNETIASSVKKVFNNYSHYDHKAKKAREYIKVFKSFDYASKEMLEHFNLIRKEETLSEKN